MKSTVVTDIELRSRWYANRIDKLTVPNGAVLTPAAKDFIRENNITLVYGAEASEVRTEVEKLVRAYDPCFSCSVH